MTKQDGEQYLLEQYGLLSLQDVLLPAVAHQEERAVKKLQSLVQRDCPEHTSAVVACRKAIYDSIAAGMRAAEQARAQRMLHEGVREQQWAEERRLKEQDQAASQMKRMEEKEQMRRVQRMEALQRAKKNFAFNQDLYREHAYLLSELPKLHKEGKAWSEAELELEKREAELDALEKELEVKESVAAAANEGNESKMQVDETSIVEVQRAIESVTASSFRVQDLLKSLSTLTTESDNVRKELYHKYRRDHQFQGYQGATNPKGLLFVLSQSQQTPQNSQQEPADM
jgi:hypothetical protein